MRSAASVDIAILRSCKMLTAAADPFPGWEWRLPARGRAVARREGKDGTRAGGRRVVDERT